MALSGSSIEKLWSFLERLSPDAGVLLIREIEAHRSQGLNDPVFELVLEAARQIVRDSGRKVPRAPTIVRLFCDPFEDMLTDCVDVPARPGRIARASIMPVWKWLTEAEANRNFAPVAQAYEADLPSRAGETDQRRREFVQEAAAAIETGFNVSRGDHKKRSRFETAIGGPKALSDARQMAVALRAAPAITALRKALPSAIERFTEKEIAEATKPIEAFLGIFPEHPELAFSTLIARFDNPTRVLRLVVNRARTTSSARLAEGPYATAGELILYDLRYTAERVAEAMTSGQSAIAVLYALKRYHAYAEGICNEIAIDPRSGWGAELTTSRRLASEALDREIRDLPQKIIQLFRPRMLGGTGPKGRPIEPDPVEIKKVERAAQLTAGVRPLVDQLSVNEALMRTEREVGQHLRILSDAILADVRHGEGGDRKSAAKWLRAATSLTRVMLGDTEAELLERAGRAAAQRSSKKAAAG
jgi:hypothetical protein